MTVCTTCGGSRFVPAPTVIRNGRSYNASMPCGECQARDAQRTATPAFRAPKIEKPADRTRGKNRDLQAEAAEWIRTHQRAAERILTNAKNLASIGMKVRVKYLVERMREDGIREKWEAKEYEVDNGFTAYIARWLIQQEPMLDGCIEFRVTKWA